MSGPIVRKYGFPNYDQIFGAKEIEHGVDEEERAGGGGTKAKATEAAPKKASEEKSKKMSE